MVGLCSYLLINFWTTRILAGKAAIKAMVVNRIGDVGLVLGMFLIIMNFNTLDFSVVFSSITNETDQNLLNFIGICFLIASAGKSAQLLLHTWLPDAMEGWVLPSINFAICGDNLKYLDPRLKFSNLDSSLEKFSEKENPQETFKIQKLESSETIRKDYNNDVFWDWFIGLVEGDGSFIVNSDTTIVFKITQSSKNLKVLEEIQKFLGFGKIATQDKVSLTYGYRVSDKNEILKIISIVNGKLQLQYRQIQFKNFLDAYNMKFDTSIPFKPSENLINLNNAWLSGFTDAEGCFTASVIMTQNKNPNIQVKFIVSQKYEKEVLLSIADLFKGKVHYYKSKNLSKKGKLEFGHNMVVNLKNLDLVIKYFSIYPLKSTRGLSFNRWLKVYYLVKNKQHINNPEVVKILKSLVKTINKA